VIIKALVIFLLFVTAWVILILVSRYLNQRGSLVTDLYRQPPAAPEVQALPAGIHPASRGACCLEVPCSDKCARSHQEMQDRLAQRYDLVAVEALRVIEQSQDPATADN